MPKSQGVNPVPGAASDPHHLPPTSHPATLAPPAPSHGPNRRRSYTALPKLSTITSGLSHSHSHRGTSTNGPTSESQYDALQPSVSHVSGTSQGGISLVPSSSDASSLAMTDVKDHQQKHQNHQHHHHIHRPHLKHRASKSLVLPRKEETGSDVGGDLLRRAVTRQQVQQQLQNKEAQRKGSIVRSRAEVEREAKEERKQKERNGYVRTWGGRGSVLIKNRDIKNAYTRLRGLYKDVDGHIDEIYYSVLERLSALRSTVVSLQDLVTQTDGLKSNFGTESDTIKKDIDGHVEAFNGFKRPKERIGALEARMKRSKDRTEGLTKRLEMAKTKAQQLESMEDVVQASITFQFRMTWAILAIMIVVFIGFRAYQANSSIPVLKNSKADDVFHEILSSILPNTTTATSSSSSSAWSVSYPETCVNSHATPTTFMYEPDDPLSLFAEL
jgi:hypothetical protein